MHELKVCGAAYDGEHPCPLTSKLSAARCGNLSVSFFAGVRRFYEIYMRIKDDYDHIILE